ncbi:hypothetical protein TNCT_436341 [Trichonephila clavata]|uniref:Endonuclease/exonuclease/phosphatase domain-containing protein n=1 Tax=Trichonephila clavata TaxID=2740835 RepID=A0A8X6KMX9_TRICU|nr:hypothetical protein TNCT_436341 [Trichonephila clavata]
MAWIVILLVWRTPQSTSRVTTLSLSAPRLPLSPRGTLVPDLLRILRNRNHCLIVGDFNAKYRSWNHLSVGNAVGTELLKFASSCGLVITTPTEATCLKRRTSSGSILNFGVSCGLQDLRATAPFEHSSNLNPVVFDLQPDFPHS